MLLSRLCVHRFPVRSSVCTALLTANDDGLRPRLQDGGAVAAFQPKLIIWRAISQRFIYFPTDLLLSDCTGNTPKWPQLTHQMNSAAGSKILQHTISMTARRGAYTARPTRYFLELWELLHQCICAVSGAAFDLSPLPAHKRPHHDARCASFACRALCLLVALNHQRKRQEHA